MNKHEREFEEKNIDKKPQPTLKKKKNTYTYKNNCPHCLKQKAPLGFLERKPRILTWPGIKANLELTEEWRERAVLRLENMRQDNGIPHGHNRTKYSAFR